MAKKENLQLFHKREILSATYELCKEVSATRVTMRDIARKSEYSLRTIYKYFRNKEEIFMDLLTSLMEEKGKWLNTLIFTEKTGLEQLYKYYQANFEYLKKFPTELQTMFYAMSTDYQTDLVAEPFINEQMDRRHKLYSVITEVYRLGIKDGSIRPDFQYDLLHEAIVHSLRTIMYLVIVLAERPEEYFWEYVKLILRSVASAEYQDKIEHLDLSKHATFVLPESIRFYNE